LALASRNAYLRYHFIDRPLSSMLDRIGTIGIGFENYVFVGNTGSRDFKERCFQR